MRVRGSTPPGTQNALTPSVLRMAPAGDQVMALIEGQIYTTTVPMVGGEAPLINVGNPDNAAVPARRLTEMGGEFPAWAASGRAVHWSLGRAFFTYDLDEAEAFEEAREAEEREEAEEAEDAEEAEEEEEAEDEEGGSRRGGLTRRVTTKRTTTAISPPKSGSTSRPSGTSPAEPRC